MKRFLLIIVAVLCSKQVPAGILYVPSAQHSTIQSAIIVAEPNDSIIVSEGLYYENIDYLGKPITVRSTDPNDPDIVAATIIDGSLHADPNRGSTVTFKNGEDNNSVLSGFTITGGTGSWLPVSWEYKGIRWNRCGGGVLCYNMSAPTITKNVFQNNTAGEGGGIYIYGDPVNPNDPSNPSIHPSPVITENSFINNRAIVEHGFDPPNADYICNEHGDGGAIVAFQGCDPIITENLFKNNSADMYGGAMHLRQWSNGIIKNNRIIDNNSTLGAGIHLTYMSSPAVTYNWIESNQATGGGGGGIYIMYYSYSLVEYNVIARNQSPYSAGIGIYANSEPLINNNLIIENTGLGILCNGGGSPVITNNTISNNYEYMRGYSGGIKCVGDATPAVENNMISSNGGNFGIIADTNIAANLKYNNIWGNELGEYNLVIGDQTGINGNISLDPNFVSVGNYHLIPSSLCVDSGDPALIPSSSSCDMDGEERLFAGRIDIGADEVVTNPADFDTDGIVEYPDLQALTGQWLSNTPDPQFDLWEDGFIDFADYTELASQWQWTGGWFE